MQLACPKEIGRQLRSGGNWAVIFAGILAGGKGTRAGKTSRPKQFLHLADGTPILIKSLRVFFDSPDIDHIVIAAPGAWLEYANALIEENCTPSELQRTNVITGGADRSGSLLKICEFIDERFGIGQDDILVSHDAVRPFLTKRILEENIEGTKKYGCVDTVVPAIDTLVISSDGDSIESIPPRNRYYQGQTPQSFYIQQYLDAFNSLTEQEKATLTDACKVFVYKGMPVHLVEGEYSNIKITTPLDILVASQLPTGSETRPQGTGASQ